MSTSDCSFKNLVTNPSYDDPHYCRQVTAQFRFNCYYYVVPVRSIECINLLMHYEQLKTDKLGTTSIHRHTVYFIFVISS